MENLRSLFEKAKIKYIISVDDCYCEATAIDKQVISQFLTNDVANANVFFKSIENNSFFETYESLEDKQNQQDYIDSLVEALDEDQCEIFRQNYYRTDDTEKSGLESFCQELKKSGIIIDYAKKNSITDAKALHEIIETIYQVNDENRILWMIDNDFHKSNGSNNSGTELISQLISSKKENHIYALTSAQIDNSTTNDMFRESLESDDYSQTLLACVIHKHFVIEKQYNELYNQMYTGFRENYSGSIIEQLKNNLSLAAQNAGNTIKSIQDDAIHNVIMLGSKAEGVSPLETFQRLMMIILKADISDQISSKYDDLSKLIFNYAELCTWGPTNSSETQDFEKVGHIRENECYDYFINKMYCPVSYGDIFEINNKYYLLVSQSCNVVIRSDGSRKAKCATLLQIQHLELPHEDESHKLLEYFKIPHKYYVSYNNLINMDFSVLDLCSLNVTGELKLLNNYNFENNKYRYTDGMRLSLQNTIIHNRQLIEKYNLIAQNKNNYSIDEIILKIRDIYKDNTTELVAEFIDGIKYNGKRLCRLSQSITDDISKRYSEYHSRKGLDFDFAAAYKEYHFKIRYNFDFSMIGLNYNELNLKESFKYYKKERIADRDLTKRVTQSFLEQYKKDDFKNLSGPKVSLHNLEIDLEPHYIPVMIKGTIYYDVFEVNDKDSSIKIKIPKEILSTYLKVKKNYTYESGVGAKKIAVSQKNVTFEFDFGQPFTGEYSEVFERAFEISIYFDSTINLEFIS